MSTFKHSKPQFLNVWHLGFMIFALAIMADAFSPAFAEPLSTNAAINKAGRQRMLSQRIVKAYAQIGMSVITSRSKTILGSSINLFEAQLTELKQFSDKADIREAILREEQLWSQVKQIIAAPVSLEGAKKLIALDEELLKAADDLTKLIESTSATKAGHLVNLSGRQRMLSQRIAKFYMLQKWGFNQPEIAEGSKLAKKSFISAMAELESSPQNTPQIMDVVRQAQIQWNQFLLATENNPNDDIGSLMVAAVASERLLEIMDKLTGLYEESMVAQ